MFCKNTRVLKNLNYSFFNLSKFQVFRRKKQDLSSFLLAEIKVNENIKTPNTDKVLKSFQEKNKHINVTLNEKSLNFELEYLKDSFNIKIIYFGKSPIPVFDKEIIEEFEEKDVKFPDEMNQFRIFVTKKENTEGLLIDAFVFESKVYILHIRYDENVFKRYEDYIKKVPSDKFISPSCEKIQRFLKKDFILFLEDLGINKNLVSFIDEFSLEREKTLYIEWLKEIKEKSDSLSKRI